MGLQGGNRRRLVTIGLLASTILIPGCTIPACDVIDDHSLRSDAAFLGKFPLRADLGEPVTLTADWSFEDRFDDAQAKGSFDLDGDGLFETDAPIRGRSQTVTRTYNSEQIVTVTHLLEASGFNLFRFDDRSVAQTTFEVDDPANRPNEPPLGVYSANPNPANVDQTVTFTSGSVDFDGTVVQHDWDLDGDGVFELIDAPTQVSTVYEEPGTYQSMLRVTDDDGAVGLAGPLGVRVVEEPNQLDVADRLTAAAASEPTELELAITGRKRSDGLIFVNGGELVETGALARGRFSPEQLPGFLRRRALKVRWAARFHSSMDIASESTNSFGVILFDYPAGGMSCLGFETEAPSGKEPTGFFRVIGGSGKGAVMRGQGTGTATFDAEGVSFSGAGGLRVAKQPFERLGKNGCPSLRDEVRRRPENSRSAG